MMDFKVDAEEVPEPVSPTGQYFNSTALSICVIAVWEFQVPIDDLPVMPLLKDLFLPINPRFSSIMVDDENGERQWKKVDVNLKNHVNVPTFRSGLSLESYDKCFKDYISKVALEPLPQSQPLWEIHTVKYPTTNAAGCLIFKLHHALGDGFSLMGALLSCLQRVDNPSLALTFPSLHQPSKPQCNNNRNSIVPKCCSAIFNTISDFGWSLLKSSFVEDAKSPIRSGDAGVEFKPTVVSTATFSLDHIKQIKSKLGVTINDVITGVIFLGTRLYMKAVSEKSTAAHSTALVLLNTRILNGYKSVEEMVKPGSESPWGNRFAFLHVSVPELTDSKASNPLEFIDKAHETIKRKRSSLAVPLTGWLLELLRKLKGPEFAAKYLRSTVKNSSMIISNMVGPVEQVALANHPVKGIYFFVVGGPMGLTINIVSYKGKLRVAVGTQKDFIDSEKFMSSIEKAFEMVYKSSLGTPSPPGTN